MVELPLIVINVQRGGPSTGMPTKTEQADFLQALFGRNGESPIAILAPRTPADCFRMAIESVRIAVEYMTPVILLSDGYIANGAEPWKLPDIDSLEPIAIKQYKPTEEPFYPYQRDPETLARPWVSPGTPGLEHRIGGLSKADLTGNVSYDPDNNEKMVRYRAEKIDRIKERIPDLEIYGDRSAGTLVLGWGSTFGAIFQALAEAQTEGVSVAGAHLNYLNPFPKNIENVLSGFKVILIPELNSGQLLKYLRAQFPKFNYVGLNKIQGQPFKVAEIVEKIKEVSA